MHIRDRIKEFRRVRASDLRPNPRNWRTHPTAQQDTLRGLLEEIGFASALVVRELEEGSLEIIDGHLRAETAADAMVPVLVLDVNEVEADKLLATFDPVSAMAGIQLEQLNDLLVRIDLESSPVKQMLHQLSQNSGLLRPLTAPVKSMEKNVPELFQVVVECAGETEQQEVFECLTRAGYMCKLQTL